LNRNDENTAPPVRPDWFSTVGRRGRLSFLGNFMFVNLGIGVVSAIAGTTPGLMAQLVAAACSIAGGWINICLTAQRLHDMNRSGWLQVVPFVAALAGVTLLTVGNMFATSLGTALLLAGCLGFMLWLLFARGVAGDNDFGAAPSSGPRRQS
jgi:uncharacterized membrane protein YhaH (DUF805 family)